MNCVYILECADKTLYTGWTNDIEKRIKANIPEQDCPLLLFILRNTKAREGL